MPPPQDSQGHAFSPGIRLEFTASSDGPIYLKLLNNTPEVAGPHVGYVLSVRDITQDADPGALVLVAGRIKTNDTVQPNIHHVTNSIYQKFLDNGYSHDDIYYLSTDTSVIGYDAWSTADNLKGAITQWARNKVGPNRAFTFYFVDHGQSERLYLDKRSNEWVTPSQLDAWLSQLETSNPGTKTNVIIEACLSGTFIAEPSSLSKPGRVVITSTDNTNSAWASDEGALFSDHFLTALGHGSSLYGSFQQAQAAVFTSGFWQYPWLDGDGDGIPNEADDVAIASARGFSYAGTLANDSWPPYIPNATGPDEISNGHGLIRAHVLDDERVQRVWAEIYPPSYQPPPVQDSLVREPLTAIILAAQGGDDYAALYTGFDERGTYRIVIHAEDDEDLEARPLAIEVVTGGIVYLPTIMK